MNWTSNPHIAILQLYQDPGAAATVTVGTVPVGVPFDGTALWVTEECPNTVSEIIPF